MKKVPSIKYFDYDDRIQSIVDGKDSPNKIIELIDSNESNEYSENIKEALKIFCSKLSDSYLEKKVLFYPLLISVLGSGMASRIMSGNPDIEEKDNITAQAILGSVSTLSFGILFMKMQMIENAKIRELAISRYFVMACKDLLKSLDKANNRDLWDNINDKKEMENNKKLFYDIAQKILSSDSKDQDEVIYQDGNNSELVIKNIKNIMIEPKDSSTSFVAFKTILALAIQGTNSVPLGNSNVEKVTQILTSNFLSGKVLIDLLTSINKYDSKLKKNLKVIDWMLKVTNKIIAETQIMDEQHKTSSNTQIKGITGIATQPNLQKNGSEGPYR